MPFIGSPDPDVVGMQSFKLAVLAHPVGEGSVGWIDLPEVLVPRQTWWLSLIHISEPTRPY